MATAQKKRAPSAGSRGGSAAKSAPGRKKSAPAPKPIRREIGAAVCFLLALFSAFGYFHIEAIFIDFFCNSVKGLFGYGFWVLPPMLLVAGIILLFHRGRPVRLRVWCALLLPVLMGSLLHLFLAKGAYTWSLQMVKDLWTQGIALQSGGVFSGVMALGFTAVFSKLGSQIVFLIGCLVLLMLAFNLTVVDIVDYFRNRPRKEYEEQPLPEPRPRERKTGLEDVQGGTNVPVKRKQAIDIPVDDPPLATAEEPIPEKKSHFFNRKSAVPTPDQVLTGAPVEPPIPPEPPASPAEVIVPAPPIAPMPEIVREPAVPKVKPAETAKAAVEVARDIEKKLDQAPPAYQYPPTSLLREGDCVIGADALGELKINQVRLTDTIHSFGIEASIANVTRGPSVTRYELELDQGVRLNKLTNLADDIALALGATGVRIAPIPDKISMVGIEVPNKLVSPVCIREVIDSNAFRENPSRVSFAVGKDIGGNCIVGNIAKLPHLLIAGTTGSGKSVCTNSLIVSLLYKSTPEEVRLIMVDPKMVELGIYNGIPHLLIPVVTDPKKAAGALQWAVTEMMKRYHAFAEAGVRDLATYNTRAAKTEGMTKMPQVVVVIDELADLMLVAAKEVEESICRVAQMGCASGMHLIIATQRPSADVITGLMKAN
ncbi:MAG: DNA translocase FtsK, partial [Pseudoflavonifractor sp.]